MVFFHEYLITKSQKGSCTNDNMMKKEVKVHTYEIIIKIQTKKYNNIICVQLYDNSADNNYRTMTKPYALQCMYNY